MTHRFPDARLPGGLYALCDDGVRTDVPLTEQARWLLEGGVGVLQLRMKRTPERLALAAAKEVVRLCRQAGAVCLVNDRVDLALLSFAHGAHVGDEDLAPADARRLLGPKRLLGVTTRSLEEIRRAQQAGADHVGLGPVFPSGTKQVGHDPLGTDGLAPIVQQSPLPVVAISGIRLDNIARVAGCGVHAAAVLSDLLLAPDVPARARALAAAFEEGQKGNGAGPG